MPDFIPKPIGFGQYRIKTPPTYFYLQQFVDMDVQTAPDPAEWGKQLAKMHKTSKSPTGKFGFRAVTCDGKTAHTVDWEDSWAVFFRKLFLSVWKRQKETNGEWPEFDLAAQQVADKVIPRLLGDLRNSYGSKIKPALIHGDL